VPLTNAQFAQGLRELAAIYESNERMVQPECVDLFVSGATPYEFRDSVLAMAVGGKVEKLPKRPDSYSYTMQRVLPSGVAVHLSIPRHSLCKRISKMMLVETWEFPDSLLDPEAEISPC